MFLAVGVRIVIILLFLVRTRFAFDLRIVIPNQDTFETPWLKALQPFWSPGVLVYRTGADADCNLLAKSKRKTGFP